MYTLTFRGCGISIYCHIQNLYGFHKVHQPYIVYSSVCALVLCQGENENVLTLGIDDQNMLYGFASKGHPDCVSELKHQ